MNIVGNICVTRLTGNGVMLRNYGSDPESSALYKSSATSTSEYTQAQESSDKYKTEVLGFNASRNWSGSTSSESAHTHSFSDTATIGSGNYTRPNSRSCKFYIKY